MIGVGDNLMAVVGREPCSELGGSSNETSFWEGLVVFVAGGTVTACMNCSGSLICFCGVGGRVELGVCTGRIIGSSSAFTDGMGSLLGFADPVLLGGV